LGICIIGSSSGCLLWPFYFFRLKKTTGGVERIGGGCAPSKPPLAPRYSLSPAGSDSHRQAL
jgi:hypothetical protein